MFRNIISRMIQRMNLITFRNKLLISKRNYAHWSKATKHEYTWINAQRLSSRNEWNCRINTLFRACKLCRSRERCQFGSQFMIGYNKGMILYMITIWRLITIFCRAKYVCLWNHIIALSITRNLGQFSQSQRRFPPYQPFSFSIVYFITQHMINKSSSSIDLRCRRRFTSFLMEENYHFTWSIPWPLMVWRHKGQNISSHIID